jgi:hypothetical protein
MTPAEEAARATELLAGKAISKVMRPQPAEVVIRLKDGTQLFVNINGAQLELSITGTADDDA